MGKDKGKKYYVNGRPVDRSRKGGGKPKAAKTGGFGDKLKAGGLMGAAAPEAAAEKRTDASDGGSYTRSEFVGLYGGVAEWDAAVPPAVQAGGGGGAAAGAPTGGGGRSQGQRQRQAAAPVEWSGGPPVHLSVQGGKLKKKPNKPKRPTHKGYKGGKGYSQTASKATGKKAGNLAVAICIEIDEFLH